MSRVHVGEFELRMHGCDLPFSKMLGLREDDLSIDFVLTFSSRDVKLKKFLEVSLLRCFWLLATFSVGSICVAQF